MADKANRKAKIKLTIMLTDQENEAFEEMVRKEMLTKALLTKWALYNFSLDKGYGFPWDDRYAVPSMKKKR